LGWFWGLFVVFVEISILGFNLDFFGGWVGLRGVRASANVEKGAGGIVVGGVVVCGMFGFSVWVSVGVL
jgi:hypothetical protein